mmetsp:Transcript_17153/g.18865  ORF Transcript_17153/g.18865 Transcript_17153/m.18865 type:complete len:84 (-) Transcript_17153:77-328(-)
MKARYLGSVQHLKVIQMKARYLGSVQQHQRQHNIIQAHTIINTIISITSALTNYIKTKIYENKIKKAAMNRSVSLWKETIIKL